LITSQGAWQMGSLAVVFASLDDEADNKFSQCRFKKDRKQWCTNDHGLQLVDQFCNIFFVNKGN